MTDRGLIHIYTGSGKGKTTCAVGLAIRARSRGLKVLFAQFMKSTPGGEFDLMGTLSVETIRFVKVLSPYFHPDADMAAIREEALKALEKLEASLQGFDLAVLDEFNYLLGLGLITKEEAREFILKKPHTLDLVLTGRGAPRWLIVLADQVTEMKNLKHPADSGLKARKGIEY